VSGSGISWAICKAAPCSRQITTPAPHQPENETTRKITKRKRKENVKKSSPHYLATDISQLITIHDIKCEKTADEAPEGSRWPDWCSSGGHTVRLGSAQAWHSQGTRRSASQLDTGIGPPGTQHTPFIVTSM